MRRTAPKEPCSIETLREMFDVDFEKGVLTWKERPLSHFKNEHGCNMWHARYCGRVAGYSRKDGYRMIAMFGRIILEHRIMLALHLGRWPVEVDHINGKPNDSSLSNLREVSRGENLRNTKRFKNNTSGATGVRWHKRDKIWQAHIAVSGKLMHLGSFKTRDDAIEARASANAKYGFHENHGRSCPIEIDDSKDLGDCFG